VVLELLCGSLLNSLDLDFLIVFGSPDPVGFMLVGKYLNQP